jgi:hypothetical protein
MVRITSLGLGTLHTQVNIMCLTRIWLKICAWKIWWANLKERDNVDDLGVGERIILKRSINKEDGRRGVDYSGSEQRKRGGLVMW